ncbi:Arylsulfatase A [Spirosomataceae bacterium TFI 002]|nr:Arylsulfatase A [Spirosomataceae bacterium TFI 002]
MKQKTISRSVKKQSLHLGLMALLLISVCSCQSADSQKSQERPNFILILIDDLGWSSYSSQMDDRVPDSKSDFFETPNIDKFSTESMRFTRGYSPDPICSPTRRSIQFGQTSIKMGDDDVFPSNYNSSFKTIPQALKAFDPSYKAAHFGKWDLRADLTPEQLGYDVSDGDSGNSDGNMGAGKENKWTRFFISENPKQVDSLTNRAIRFMKSQVASKSPFYLQVSHYATHADMVTRQKSYDKFKAKTPGVKHNNPAWAGMIHDLDEKIGELVDMVEELGISDNTYIVLMADNGAVEFLPPVKNKLDLPSTFKTPMRNAPLRAGKWTLFEGGIRVPFMVKGPDVEKGSMSDVPVVGWDLLSTFNDLAGNKNISKNVEGGSFADVLKNKGKGKVERSDEAFYFHRFAKGYPHSAVIVGDYKLLKFWKSTKVEMYNIAEDLGETKDLAKSNPEKAKELEATLLDYMKTNNPELLTASIKLSTKK